MKLILSITFIFVVFSSIIFITLADDDDVPDYASDLKKAEILLKQTIKGYGIDNDNQEDDASETLSQLKTQVYKYVLESKTGKKYFLHLLMLFHEILNDPNVKKVLDFLQENEIDIMKVFSINVPSSLYESLQDYQAEESDSKKETTKESGNLDVFASLQDIVDVPKLLKTWKSLLDDNSAVKHLWTMMCSPGWTKGILDLVKKPEYKSVLEDIVAKSRGSSGGGVQNLFTAKMIFGFMKMCNVHGDRRSISWGDRFMEGLDLILKDVCATTPGNKDNNRWSKNICKMMTDKKTEL